jgi:hypothetical protein
MAKAARAIHLLITLLPSEFASGEVGGRGGLGPSVIEFARGDSWTTTLKLENVDRQELAKAAH